MSTMSTTKIATQRRKLSRDFLSNMTKSFHVIVTVLSLCITLLLLTTPATDAFAPSTSTFGGSVQQQKIVSSLNYAASASPSSSPASLRDILSQTTTTPSWATAAAAKREENDLASVIREINTLEDYQKLLQDSAQQQHAQQQQQYDASPPLTVVRFHATYCAACKRATPSFHRMVRKFVSSFPNNKNKNIQWVDVAVSKHNVDLQKHVGLKSIPSAFLYHPKAGLVEQLSINKNKLSHFEETLETYIEGQCPVQYTAEGEVSTKS